jgi:hypothetical protein
MRRFVRFVVEFLGVLVVVVAAFVVIGLLVFWLAGMFGST